MIKTDGERSKKMLWFAKKQLRLIKEFDIPAKTVKVDGYTISVNQQDDIEGGMIKSPMGVVVTCTTIDGVKIAVADSWLGIFSPAQSLYHINNEVFASTPYATTGDAISGYSSEYLTEAGITTEETIINDELWHVNYSILYATANQSDYRDSLPAFPTGLTDVERLPGSIAIYPYHSGEGFWVSFSDLVTANSGAIKSIVDISRTFYASNNRSLAGRKTISYVSGDQRYTNEYHQHMYSVQHVSEGEFLITNFADYRRSVDYIGGDVFFEYGYKATESTDGWTFEGLRLDDLLGESSGIPDELLEFYVTDYEMSILRLGTTYSFMFGDSTITLHYAFVPTVSGSTYYPSVNPQDFRDYMYAHPEYRKWDTLVVFNVDGVSHVFNADDIGPSLDQIFDAEIYDEITGEQPDNAGQNWLLQNALIALFPYSSSSRIPHDHAMFHSHTGAVHSWTRYSGSAEFSTSGLSVSNAIMPVEVTEEEGIRPVVSWTGTFDEAPMYSCVCEDVANNTVKAVCYGNPFASVEQWSTITEYDDGQLISVRPVLVRPDKQIFIGVVKTERSVDDPTEVYKFAFYSNGAWTTLSELPFGVTSFDKFSLCLFGDDPLVKSMIDIPYKEIAEPQDAVPPYQVYDYVRFI